MVGEERKVGARALERTSMANDRRDFEAIIMQTVRKLSAK
jgi:hypothetical protein